MEKTTAVRQIWLLYFNRVLREKALISPEDYQKMQRRILHTEGVRK